MVFAFGKPTCTTGVVGNLSPTLTAGTPRLISCEGGDEDDSVVPVEESGKRQINLLPRHHTTKFPAGAACTV